MPPELAAWTTAGTFYGTGQAASIWVQRLGAPAVTVAPAGVAPPTHTFVVWAYGDGRSLVSWRSDDGRALGRVLTAANGGDFTSVTVPFIVADTGTGASAARIAVQFIQRPATPAATNVGGGLLVADAARLALFTGARSALLAAANAPASSQLLKQTGAITGTTNSSRFFRVRMTQMDSDGDGIFDDLELANSSCVTNPFNSNTDFDNLDDATESALGYCPDGDGDQDGDGLSDALELANGSDSRSADTDGDGLSDALDSHPQAAATLPTTRYALVDLGPEFAPTSAADPALLGQCVTDRGTVWLGRSLASPSTVYREDIFWQGGRVFRLVNQVYPGEVTAGIYNIVLSVSRGGYAVIQRHSLWPSNSENISAMKVIQLDDFLAAQPAGRSFTFAELPAPLLNPFVNDPVTIAPQYGSIPDNEATLLALAYEQTVFANPSSIYSYVYRGIEGAAVSDHGLVAGTIRFTYTRYPSQVQRNFRYAYQWSPTDHYRSPLLLTDTSARSRILDTNLNFTAVNDRGQALTKEDYYTPPFTIIPPRLVTLPRTPAIYPSGETVTDPSHLANTGYTLAQPSSSSSTVQPPMLWHSAPLGSQTHRLPTQLYTADTTSATSFGASPLPVSNVQLIALNDRFSAGGQLSVGSDSVPCILKRLSLARAGSSGPPSPYKKPLACAASSMARSVPSPTPA
jgi:hypothetical protein